MTKQWFPLESNPTVMTGYAEKLGLDINAFQFCDVLSTEDWALSMLPTPVVSLIMLFPISDASETHRVEEEATISSTGQPVSPHVYYMKQTVSNACGTVGILHAILNAKDHLPAFSSDSYLAKFNEDTRLMSPDERAAYLEADDNIESVHEAAAAEGQSEQLDADNVNSHFVCFSVVDGCLYELDGRKQRPINHGPSSIDTLLSDSCRVVKDFMNRDPAELRFTMVALAPPVADEE